MRRTGETGWGANMEGHCRESGAELEGNWGWNWRGTWKPKGTGKELDGTWRGIDGKIDEN